LHQNVKHVAGIDRLDHPLGLAVLEIRATQQFDGKAFGTRPCGIGRAGRKHRRFFHFHGGNNIGSPALTREGQAGHSDRTCRYCCFSHCKITLSVRVNGARIGHRGYFADR
jgi:hypothetical protein